MLSASRRTVDCEPSVSKSSMSAADTMQSGNQDPQPAHAPICDGDTVVLDVNGEKQAFVTVKRNGYVRLVVQMSLRHSELQ